MLMAPAVVAAAREIDPRLPVVEIRSLATVVEEYLLPQRALRSTLAALGLVSLCLTMLGVYGIVMCYVTERTREMGIRLAVGADGRQIIRYVVGRGLRLAIWGAAIGMPLAVITGVAMRGMLFGVSAVNPLTYLAVATVVTLVAALASFVPARRAARINPLVAMRAE
jgi:ABC-type antimicrobial peptide transport system permease subunit